jgi:hypothetical protein
MSPSGQVWKIGIEIDDTPYLVDSEGNKAVWLDPLGNVLKQFQMSGGGCIEYTERFNSFEDLPTPPVLISGTVPEALYYEESINRDVRAVYTQGAWRRELLAEEILPTYDPIPHGIGDVWFSFLTQAETDALYGPNKCVIVDGRAIGGSTLAGIKSWTNIPDGRDAYLRAKLNGRSDGFQTLGELPIGVTLSHQFQDHIHLSLARSALFPQSGSSTFCWVGGIYVATTGADSGNAGSETRPNTMIVNMYTRIS